MQHMLDAAGLLEQALKMESYGAQGIILMDSAGWSLPHDVREKTKALVGGLSVPVGFHAHNNLSMAVANSIEAVEAGALIIDGTSRGFGAGAGNCALEALVAILNRLDVPTGADLYTLLDNSETIVTSFGAAIPTVNSTTLLSGLAGIFSGFCPLAEKAAARFKVDVRDIIMELGKRRVVAGQEDFIVEIAMELAEKKAKDLACTF
jgi:4-hydroxy 2-oxovalerate aldolase